MHSTLVAAFVTRGLEDVATDEIVTTAVAAAPVESRPKLVLCRTEDPRKLGDLRTVDDIAVVSAISADALDKAAFEALVAGSDLEDAIDKAGRGNRRDGTFSVTVSAARSVLGSAAEIEAAASSAISRQYGWRHLEGQRSSIDVRVFIDGDWTLIGVRLFDDPLARRTYRLANVRGSLRPTVAAALVRLASPDRSPRRVWDPFCGSGTILCEAAIAGAEVWGTDIDEAAVDAARTNIATVNREFWSRIERGDSTISKTWHKHRSVTNVVSNLPWGKQVAIKSKQALYDTVSTGVVELARRGGTGVLLTTEPDRIMQRLRRASDVSVTQRRIGLLGQQPTVLTLRSAK